jgi:hypothetical protein
MREKIRFLCSLTTFVILCSLAFSVSPQIVRASPGTEIWDWYDLHAIRGDLGGHYTLRADLDATVAGYTELASATANNGKGWQPIGTWSDGFTGYFDGKGDKIADLFINRPGELHVGLFGSVGQNGVVEELSVTNASVAARSGVGVLVGSNFGTVSNCYASGSVAGAGPVGGLVGMNRRTVINSRSSSTVAGVEQVGVLLGFNDGIVSNSSSSGEAAGYWFVGGLVGSNRGSVINCDSASNATGYGSVGGLAGENRDTVRNARFSGSVSGNQQIGGLVGTNWHVVRDSYSNGRTAGKEQVGGLVGHNLPGSAVNSCYSTSAVIGDSRVGGLVGENDGGTVTASYSAGGVNGKGRVGGLVGWNQGGTVTTSYASGSVDGESYVGGLVGDNHAGNVSDSYSVAIVTGQEQIGGLVGWNDEGVVTNSFWDVQASGVTVSPGGTGKITAQMQSILTFTNLDEPWDIVAVDFGIANIDHIWNVVDGQVYPFLSWDDPPVSLHDLTISATDGGFVTATVNGNQVVIGAGETVTLYDISAGTRVDLVATPDAWYRFVEWRGEPRDGIANPVISIIVQGAYVITASFEEMPTYQLTISSTGGGWVTTPGEGTFTYYTGTVVSLLATPSSGYRFIRWTGDVVSVGDVDAVSTTIIMDRDYSITASFRTIAGCFIATAAYGTPVAQEVQVLREFRDEYLLTDPAGEALVALYYRISPPIAEFISEHPALKPVIRTGLVPAIGASKVIVNTSSGQKLAILGLLALTSLAVAAWTSRRRVKGRIELN